MMVDINTSYISTQSPDKGLMQQIETLRELITLTMSTFQESLKTSSKKASFFAQLQTH